MKSSSIIGTLMTILGVVALAYQGITFTTQKKILDIGPIQVQATTEEHETIPLPPLVGGLALVGGVALLITDDENT